jgi:hypothetical protein
MIRCGLVEETDAAMARFHGGLNREIQDILDYKVYYDITTLFEFACKAEREIQGHRLKPYSNSFARRRSTSGSAPAPPAPSTPATTPRERAATSAGAPPSTGRTWDIQCFRCQGFGYVSQDCPNKHVLVIRDDGEYSSASDSEDIQHAMLATDHAAKAEVHVNLGDTDRYESPVVQHVLSTQVAPPKKNQ